MTPIGEIIEATTTTFRAGTYAVLQAPDFGALVRAEGRNDCVTYGLVYAITTASREQGGRAVVRGRAGMYDGDIYAANPDLEAVLQTEFVALTVGHRDGTVLHQHLPAQPPSVHYSVHAAEREELLQFTQRLGFLQMVLQSRDIPADEVIGAFLSQAAAVQPDPYVFRITVGRQLALLLRDDHRRLLALLEHIRPS